MTTTRVGLSRGGGGRLVAGRYPRSLLGRVFVVNAALLTLAVVLLAITPLTVSNPVTPRQLSLLGAGLVLLVAANFALLRVSLRPLSNLTTLMQRIDLLRPGERLDVSGVDELSVLLVTFNEMLDRLERERRVSSRRTLDREEGERRRIASELHDQVGQGLTALLLQLSTLIAEEDGPRRESLVEARNVVRSNLDEVRRIARHLRPTVLDDLGLPYALAALADAVEGTADVEIIRTLDVGVPQLPESTELALYRIAQEALTNVARHSNASRVTLRLSVEGRDVTVAVEDDGRGMIFAEAVEGGGVRGMRERATAVGATLTIESSPGRGTRVVATARVAG